MIPAHAWDSIRCVAAGRPLWTDRRWAILGPEGTPVDRYARPLRLDSSPGWSAMTAPVPDDAWRGTARELAALLAPAVGEHCPVCDDLGELACSQCRDGCVACDGEGVAWCGCRPPGARFVVIRGARHAATLLMPLRGLLHGAGAAALVAVWWAEMPLPVPGPDDATRPMPVLVVDVSSWRYALPPALPTPGDELVEVSL